MSLASVIRSGRAGARTSGRSHPATRRILLGLLVLLSLTEGRPAELGAAGGKDLEDGWLVPVDEHWALAQVLDRWAESPQLARQMGQRGRAKVLSRFTSARVADVAEGVYVRALRTRDRSRRSSN